MLSGILMLADTSLNGVSLGGTPRLAEALLRGALLSRTLLLAGPLLCGASLSGTFFLADASLFVEWRASDHATDVLLMILLLLEKKLIP
jgi:hypothetical protein